MDQVKVLGRELVIQIKGPYWSWNFLFNKIDKHKKSVLF